MATSLLFCCPCSTDSKAQKFDPKQAELDWENYQARLARYEVEEAQLAEDTRVARAQLCSLIAGIAYPVLGAICTCFIIWTNAQYPLVPLLLEDPNWGQQWLIAAVVDYYTCAFCLIGIILASEDCVWGVIWTSQILVLGAPFACAYLVSRVCTHSTLALLSARQPLRASSLESGVVIGYTSGFYVVAGVSFLIRLSWTLWRYPLYPLQEDPEWLSEWLFTTVGDYSLAAFCLCGVIFATEAQGANVAWCALVLALSGPGACAYTGYRALCCQSLTLSNGHIADRRSERTAMLQVTTRSREARLQVDPGASMHSVMSRSHE